MKSLRVLVLVSSSPFFAVPTYAQEEPKTEFISSEALELSAEKRTPNVEQMSVSKRARFERLSSMKRSFSGELRQSIAALR